MMRKRGQGVILFHTRKEAVMFAVKLISQEINKNPRLTLGLASGKTMIPLYRELVALYQRKKISFANVTIFNLDEYIDGGQDRLWNFMNKHFFRNVDVQKKNIHFLQDTKPNLKRTCDNYEKEIKNVGGIDLQILGIGRNSHIGFNEPGSSFESRTRKVRLSRITRKDFKESFNAVRDVPRYALTMGIATILESKKILLIAFGSKKARAIARAISAPASKEVPASALQQHNDATFIVDKLAAAQLRQSLRPRFEFDKLK